MPQKRDEIVNFRQMNGEPLFEAWERFNGKLAQCPNHEVPEVPEKMLLEIFYRALDPLNKMVVANAASGSLVKLHHHVAFLLIGEVSKQNRGWHTQETEAPKIPSTTSMVDNEQRKRNEEKEENMAKMMTQQSMLWVHPRKR